MESKNKTVLMTVIDTILEEVVWVNQNGETISLKDVYNMSPYDLARYLNKRKIFTLSDLVEYFIKNY